MHIHQQDYVQQETYIPNRSLGKYVSMACLQYPHILLQYLEMFVMPYDLKW